MMNMNDKTKRNLLIAGLCVICVGLIFAISSRFQTETPTGGENTPATLVKAEVTPDINNMEETAEKTNDKELVIQLDEPIPAPTDKPADQTDQPVQNLQPDVTKPPEPSGSQKTDPGKNPDGEKFDTVKPVEHDKVTKPENSSSPSTPKAGDKNDKGQMWVRQPRIYTKTEIRLGI
ncbi:hypothetical protein Dtox_0426 [Desulfofarcimen acetoxidans DSM 771]|uniref:Uncharacterized protein n=1 Tax=Desulfofarcimen acetoxidans (strain ATCC 49208 / DSM 771 / KCTC 5769 / VKM B-1644 / 5575) TaxID=485916 RepID=C8W511_DESAS|nr:DUF6550 family protein [Desulfofarcimen acetoxidans]ACV61363.1 hypothetical protein Dtox_0426 [Desulfofarcimen acetoxidans DSM 771]